MFCASFHLFNTGVGFLWWGGISAENCIIGQIRYAGWVHSAAAISTFTVKQPPVEVNPIVSKQPRWYWACYIRLLYITTGVVPRAEGVISMGVITVRRGALRMRVARIQLRHWAHSPRINLLRRLSFLQLHKRCCFRTLGISMGYVSQS